jgi:phage host-nuclease inhibitor protein Gam
MAKKTLEQIAEHSKIAWGVGRLMSKLATNAFSQVRTKRSYAKRIKALEDERNAKLALKTEEQKKIVGDMMTILENNKGGFVTGLKSIGYAVGKVGFREMKPSVEIAEGFTEEGVVKKFLRRHRAYLRFKPALNREKILQDHHDGKWKTLSGITIRKGAEFFVSLSPRGKDKPEVITVPVSKK